MQEDTIQPLIACKLTIESGSVVKSNVNAVLFPDKLVFEGGLNRTLCLNTLCGIRAEQYKIYILEDSGTVILSMIGHWYEDFAAKLIRTFNEIVFSESLMKEKTHFETRGQYLLKDGKTVSAAFRVCETALVILPDTHDLVRIPLCMIAKSNITPYRLVIEDRIGRFFALQKMGMNTDAFLKAYHTRTAELLKQTKECLGVIAAVNDELAELLLDGIVANVRDISDISPGFAGEMDKYMLSSAIADEYAFLKERSDCLAIGMKRGLMGELTGESIILLAPVFERNVMFMESLGETASATYVFSITETAPAEPEQWNDFLLRFNYSMLSVNYRREPVYLSDEALKSDKHIEYRNALRRVPELLELRKRFLGRVIHNGIETWEKSIASYIE